MFWDQTEKVLDSFLEQAVWVPEEGKKAFRQWVHSNRNGCESFRAAMEDGLKRMESCFRGVEKTGEP